MQIVIKEGKEKNLLKHHPWVFSGAIEENTVPSTCGVYPVYSSDERFIAWGYYDNESHIQLRLLSWDESNKPDDAWWQNTVRNSVLRRRSFFENKEGTNVFRIVHGEADMLPGFACDVYSRIIRIIISARVAFAYRKAVVSELERLLHPDMIILNTDSSFCSIEHLGEVTEYYIKGCIVNMQTSLDEIRVREDGIYYALVPGTGQKSGFFCDQRENRRRLETYCKGQRVLDLCCYTGGFTLHALRGGALSVDCIDSSSDAVHRLLSNIHLNEDLGTLPQGSREKVNAKKADVFEFLRTVGKNSYDVIVLDPPKLAKTIKGLEEAKKGYKDLNRLAMIALKNGGILVSCSCSGSLSREDFKTVIAWSAKDCGYEVQILETLGQAQDHPIRLSFPESEYLKVFIMRVIKNEVH